MTTLPSIIPKSPYPFQPNVHFLNLSLLQNPRTKKFLNHSVLPLLDAGNKLIDPLSSVDELLPLLDVSVLFFFFFCYRFSFLFLVLDPFGLILFVIVYGVVLFVIVLCVKPRFRGFHESILSSQCL